MDLFLSSGSSIYSTKVFPPSGNSDHVIVSVSIDFPSNPKRDVLFHCIAYDYSRGNWDGVHHYLRDNSWEDIFKLGASAAAGEFCTCVQIGINVYMAHQASLISMVFSCLWCFGVVVITTA